MVFSSASFLFFFLPVLMAVYFCPLFRGQRAKNLILLGFSLFFYSMSGWKFLPLLLLSIALNYCVGLALDGAADPGRRKRLVVWGVVLNLGILGVFKYLSFLTGNLRLLFPWIPPVSLELPVGISFYTFQGLSYLLDVYYGRCPANRNPLHVALYVSLFPQLIAGPIVRYTTIAKELGGRKENLDRAADGLRRFLLGLSKKVLIANQMGIVADSVFDGLPANFTTGTAWLGMLAYTFQIYFDFSGYSDMAIGLGKVFGFSFLENFDHPYVSRSVSEFWRRWHISLGSWFRDYLYIPLGGNRVGRRRQILNLWIVWALTGLWHGAAWNFVLWGVYYALLLTGERFLWRGWLQRAHPGLLHVYTMLCVMIGWVLFRINHMADFLPFVQALFGFAPDGLWCGKATYLLLQFRYEYLIALVASLPVCKKLEAHLLFSGAPASRRNGWYALGCFGALALGFLSVVSLIGTGYNPFIYFQF